VHAFSWPISDDPIVITALSKNAQLRNINPSPSHWM